MNSYTDEALEYIAKIADGGMRDAITLMDKCLAYSTELTLKNVVKALGTTDYDTMFELTDLLVNSDFNAIKIIEDLHSAGKDLKQFIKLYMQFILDVNKYIVGCDWKYINIPKLDNYETMLKNLSCKQEAEVVSELLSMLINLNSEIKYSQSVKYDIEAEVMRWCLWSDKDS